MAALVCAFLPLPSPRGPCVGHVPTVRRLCVSNRPPVRRVKGAEKLFCRAKAANGGLFLKEQNRFSTISISACTLSLFWGEAKRRRAKSEERRSKIDDRRDRRDRIANSIPADRRLPGEADMAEGGVQTTALPMMADTMPAATSDYSAMFVLLVTLLGFVLPMLLVYPPVRPRPSDFLNETHSRLGVQKDERNRDRADKKDGHVSELWIYPIEACRGIQLSRSRLRPSGLELDRLFSLAQRKGPDAWVELRAAHFARLAALQVELWRPDRAKAQRWQDRMRASDSTDRASTLAQTFVLVRYPWGPERRGAAGLWERLSAKLARGWRAVPEVEIVFPLVEAEDLASASTTTTVCKSSDGRVVPAIDLSAEIPPSLQLYLGVSCQLGLFRIVDQKPAAPVCLLNNNSSSSISLDQQRLCPNIVLSGVPAHDNDSWKTVRLSPSLPGADHPLDARFQVDHDTDGHRLLLTPLFPQKNGSEPVELTIDVGMAVNVVERDEQSHVRC
ncbi:hypothetical protein CMQ_4386 [Grosmannia clavigera kw1407]|uniref:Molybdenum cofactor sulfurase middle domain-containing protein n=1 Tax=Grosmannia clavigera (strain kw1407 / UAMH 11150) TaxID=655863 RepID=F0XUS1_GROCL|nr:uncharacterized protein CMQ_4386 [Grosmannia clavigera kw1407]EFW98534.1 hypothetical protein CMQ_4386 [Grosmannia clavigera kw1407]